MSQQDEATLTAWQDFYRRHFNEDHNFSALSLPETAAGFGTLIVVAKGLTPLRAAKRCAELFGVHWYAYNMDRNEGHGPYGHSRIAHEDYALWLEDGVSCIEETEEAFQLATIQHRHDGMTMLERLLLELKYFDETGEHPYPSVSSENYLLCFGTWNENGSEGRRDYIAQMGWCSSENTTDPNKAFRFSPHLGSHFYYFGASSRLCTKFKKVVVKT